MADWEQITGSGINENRALGVLVEQQGHFLGLAASQQSIHVHTIASLFSRPSVPTLEGADQEVGVGVTKGHFLQAHFKL